MKYYNPNKIDRRKNRPVYDKRYYRKLDIPEKKKEVVKKKFFTLPKIAAMGVAIATLAVALVLIIPSTAKAQYAVGYEVFLCGKSIGIVDSPDEVDSYLADVRTQFAEAYGMKVTDQLEIEYKKVETNAKHICPAPVFTNMIASSIDVKVLATVIYVNDWAAAVVPTAEDAEWVLSQATAPYENTSNGAVYSDISFVEEVRVEEGAVVSKIKANKRWHKRDVAYAYRIAGEPMTAAKRVNG